MVNHWINSITQTGKDLNPDDYAFANVFITEGNELLKAVSAYSVLPNAQVTARVYLLNDNYTNPEDGQLVSTVSSTLENQGFLL